MAKIKRGGHIITISNDDKLLFKKAKITKKEYVDYYADIAPIMISHTKNRLISMYRFPDGAETKGFYQKDASDYFPDWIERVPVEREDGQIVNYIMINDAATLLYVANLVCVPHIWLSKEPKLNYPDRIIFDLDPSGSATFSDVKFAAKKIKTLLDELELPTFVMTTGSRGLHIVIPLKATETFDPVREFARDIAEYLVAEYPNKLTLEMRKNKRGNKIFVDYLRIAWGATGVAPYAVRAKEQAPIATPLEWDELDSTKSAQKYTIKNIFRRLAQTKDPWKNINKSPVSLKKARAAFKKIKKNKGDG